MTPCIWPRPVLARDIPMSSLCEQVADWLDEQLNPRGIGVVIEAEHLCMLMRGVQAAGIRG